MDPRSSQSSTKPTSTSPDSPAEPAWPTLRAHLLAVAAETGEHPLRHLLTAASGRDLRTAGDMAAVLDWRLTSAQRLPTQVRCPGCRAFHQRSMPIPSGGPIWQSDPNLSPSSPIRSKITSAKVTGRQSGLHREATRAPPWFAKSQCGGPPTGSIRKTRDQPEEDPTRDARRPAGNNASTGISLMPPTRQQMRGPTSDRQHTPQLDAGTTTGSAHTKNPNGARAGRPRPAGSRTGSTWRALVPPLGHAAPRT